MQSELKNCINNFEPFASRFEINELEKPVADVSFNENDVKRVFEMLSDFELMKKEFESYGVYANDIYANNVGIKNGKVACFDCKH